MRLFTRVAAIVAAVAAPLALSAPAQADCLRLLMPYC